MKRARWSALLITVALAAAACTPGSPDPPVGPGGEVDPVLVTGQQVYENECSRCHGDAGGGGFGPKLSDGQVAIVFPDIEDEIASIADGRSGMPGFATKLGPDEIEAVARYTREAL